ncbi:MAG: hypothetical protein ACRDTT_19740, partial [Pseudonocardiaceae bacterium]
MSTTDHTATNQTESGSSRLQTTEGQRRHGLSWWQASAVGAVAATVANLVILFIGRAAGASFVVLDGTNVHVVGTLG